MKLTKEILSKGPKEYFLNLRKRTGMSRKEVSLRAGCTAYFIKQIESNEEPHYCHGLYDITRVLELYRNVLNLKESDMLSVEDAKYLVRQWQRIRYSYTGHTSWARQRLVNILGNSCNSGKSYNFEDESFLEDILDLVESKIIPED